MTKQEKAQAVVDAMADQPKIYLRDQNGEIIHAWPVDLAPGDNALNLDYEVTQALSAAMLELRHLGFTVERDIQVVANPGDTITFQWDVKFTI